MKLTDAHLRAIANVCDHVANHEEEDVVVTAITLEVDGNGPDITLRWSGESYELDTVREFT